MANIAGDQVWCPPASGRTGIPARGRVFLGNGRFGSVHLFKARFLPVVAVVGEGVTGAFFGAAAASSSSLMQVGIMLPIKKSSRAVVAEVAENRPYVSVHR